MAEPLFELLVPYFDSADAASRPRSPATDPTAAKYLNRLTTLSLSALKTTERQSLSQASHSNLLSLQALSNRSHKAFITSADNLSSLRTSIPKLAEETNRLRNAIPKLDEEAVRFSSTYSKNAENQTLDRRKQAMQLARNVDRLSDILELPALLATAVSSSSVNTGASSTSYSSALDLFAHIKRLQTLYPDSPLMKDIAKQAENAMKDMTSNLIAGLRVQNIRLAAAIRTVGWLRRVAPELETATGPTGSTGVMQGEGAFGALFLVCRLANLITMLEALEPLRELADQETKRRLQNDDNPAAATSNSTLFRYEGQQTERFLKRYIEIFREQSFAIVSLYKNIFAPPPETELPVPTMPGLNFKTTSMFKSANQPTDPLSRLPPALATFPMHLAEMLMETLRVYLPNVKDKSSRESLLTQVLYCAGSLARLGGDFSMFLSLLAGDYDDDDDNEEGPAEGDSVAEWEEVMKKHRVLAERLDQLTAQAGESGAKSKIATHTH